MRFNCGLSPNEKWQISKQKTIDALDKLTEWHSWFAWYPVRIANGDCRWLETIQRKAKYTAWKTEGLFGAYVAYEIEYEYKPSEVSIKDDLAKDLANGKAKIK